MTDYYRVTDYCRKHLNCESCELHHICEGNKEWSDDTIKKMVEFLDAKDKPADAINPDYYKGSIESIDLMVETQGEEAVKGFCICNAMKYLYRHKKKNGIEDIKKAIWYLSTYLGLEERVMKGKE